MCRIWYSFSRTVSDDNAHRGGVVARSREPTAGAYGASRRTQEPAHNEHEDADREKAVTDDVHQKTVLLCRPGGFPTIKYIGGYAENRGGHSGRQHHPP